MIAPKEIKDNNLDIDTILRIKLTSDDIYWVCLKKLDLFYFGTLLCVLGAGESYVGVFMLKGMYTQVEVCMNEISWQSVGPCGSCIDLHIQRCCLCLADQYGSHPSLMAMCSFIWSSKYNCRLLVSSGSGVWRIFSCTRVIWNRKV